MELSPEAKDAKRAYKNAYMRDYIKRPEVKEAKNAYMRNYMKQWRKENPEKVLESQIRYWEKRANSFTSQPHQEHTPDATEKT